jgi:hypothetical protein
LGASFFQQKALIGLLVQFTPFSKNASKRGTLFSMEATECTSAKEYSPNPDS